MTSLTRKQHRQQERKQQKLIKKLGKIPNKALARFNKYKYKYKYCIVDTSKNMGLSKLSDFISDFAEPLYDASWDADGIEDIYDLVCCCWNIGTCSKKYQDLLWNILIKTKLYECFDDPDGILANKLHGIIDKRRAEFTEGCRFIVDFFLTFTKDNCMNLQIASAQMPQEQFLAIQAARALSRSYSV